MITAAIEAHEGRHVKCFDIPGAYLRLIYLKPDPLGFGGNPVPGWPDGHIRKKDIEESINQVLFTTTRANRASR